MVHLIVRRRRVRDDAFVIIKVGDDDDARARAQKKRENHIGPVSTPNDAKERRVPRSRFKPRVHSIKLERVVLKKRKKKTTRRDFLELPKLAKIKVVSAAIKHAPPKAAPHGFFSAHAPKCADASTTAQIPSASFADTSGGRWIVIIADDIPARNLLLLGLLLLLLLGRRLKVTVFGRPVKTSSSSSSNLDENARNEERGTVRVLFDGETRDSSVAFGDATSRKDSAHFDDSIFL